MNVPTPAMVPRCPAVKLALLTVKPVTVSGSPSGSRSVVRILPVALTSSWVVAKKLPVNGDWLVMITLTVAVSVTPPLVTV
ncbi:hypothetical protein D3C78_1882380 [compost metagenome]